MDLSRRHRAKIMMMTIDGRKHAHGITIIGRPGVWPLKNIKKFGMYIGTSTCLRERSDLFHKCQSKNH